MPQPPAVSSSLIDVMLPAAQAPQAVGVASASRLRWLWRSLVVGLAYYLTGRLGLLLPYQDAHITLLWLPSGIAMAALLRWGSAMAPAIALAAACTALSIGSSFALSLALALGNTAGPWLGSIWLRRVGFRHAMDRPRDVLAYLAIGAGFGMVVTATNGVVALMSAGLIGSAAAPAAWLGWWLGDAIGALIAGVPLLTWPPRGTLRRRISAVDRLLNAALVVVAFGTGSISFLQPPGSAFTPFVFIPHLLLAVLAIRAGLHYASLTALVLAAVAAWGTATGQGPLYSDNVREGLSLLWGYIATLTALPLLIAVLVAERSRSEDRWQLALEGTGTGVADWDVREGRVQYSRRWKAMLGYAVHEIGTGIDEWRGRVHTDDLARLQAALDELLAGRRNELRIEHRLRCRDGRWKWFELHARVVERSERGNPLRLISTAIDVTERHGAAERQRLSTNLVQHLHEGLVITDAQCRILHVNPAYTRLTGTAREELIGTVPALLQPDSDDGPRDELGEDLRRRRAELRNALKAGDVWRGELIAQRRSASRYTQQITVSVVRNATGDVEHHVLAVSDITTARQQREQLERQAHYDPLTQLPNRLRLATLLREAIAAADRDGHSLAIAYLDLDHFKPLNDQFGHDAGDRLLAELSQRLRSALRGHDVVARLGGDEFVLLMRTTSMQECSQALQRVLQAVTQPYTMGMPRAWNVTASIGVTVYPSDRADADTLLRHADHAMYGAKQAGRNQVQFFDPELDRQTMARREAARRVDAAIAAGEFILYYQPKVDMRLREVVGFEALLRWQRPQYGLLPPSEFLPLVETAELAVKLGDWVIDQALRQLSNWSADGLHLNVSVNISGRHLQHPEFAERLRELLTQHDPLLARRLELEVLETAALADPRRTSEVMDRCRTLGVRFALDDFGTGYSQLTYLRDLPIDALKIDRSFVRGMLEAAADRAIVEGVIALSRTFGCAVIAEGVESAEQASALVAAGCSIGQGYGIAAPMPAAAVPGWVDGYRAHVAVTQPAEPV
ncbi:bifunctional diguanylate cyclase/phosphodiesterase [Rivibacter subsaxonicus]|uniref:PAS domain S-box-containing protein/diguanylate cyclase (GGDEF)-like protein n=1 Tax=Rivibacter subsaxonicus TaxID=457575 RepID=A0A4Q7VNW5_9BURK|nr:EAL domain-containing protein [Rivibacter subsaxonicus]RZT98073.1 PAS domain S-box-containing protein/diguanylate cyclase (GGDEF)-like protein [Rivibacter subsaxonicus]